MFSKFFSKKLVIVSLAVMSVFALLIWLVFCIQMMPPTPKLMQEKIPLPSERSSS